MSRLTVTARGQVTFRKEVLRHLGLEPGDKLELDLLPGGQGLLKAASKNNDIDEVIGFLAKKTRKTATIEDINDAAAAGWAGKR